MVRRLFHVAFGILIVVVVGITAVIWYVVATQQNLDQNQTYFTCYGLPDVHHALSEAGATNIDYVDTDGSIFDDQGIESVCHEAYVGGSTQQQTQFDQQLEAAMDTFSNGKNYEVHPVYKTDAHVMLFVIVYAVEYFVFLMIARVFRYIANG
jgi:hypothetical protein